MLLTFGCRGFVYLVATIDWYSRTNSRRFRRSPGVATIQNPGCQLLYRLFRRRYQWLWIPEIFRLGSLPATALRDVAQPRHQHGQIFAPAISAFPTSMWVTAAAGPWTISLLNTYGEQWNMKIYLKNTTACQTC